MSAMASTNSLLGAILLGGAAMSMAYALRLKARRHHQTSPEPCKCCGSGASAERRVLSLASAEAAGLSALAERALQLASEAVAKGNHPFSAILFATDSPTDRSRWLVECVNEVNQNSDLTAHAEIVAIRKAGEQLSLSPGQTLKGYSMIMVADPCPMCMGALLWAQIDAAYFLFHRDAVESYEVANLSSMYGPVFRSKLEMYEQLRTASSNWRRSVPLEALQMREGDRCDFRGEHDVRDVILSEEGVLWPLQQLYALPGCVLRTVNAVSVTWMPEP
eukprot:6207900-Pleurochrysis_carterae.AAC.1